MYRVIFTTKLALVALFALTVSAFAQVSDPRVFQLEEQVRQLNGKVEELNFEILQMQENLRKQQEDLEFRIQELEDNGSSSTKEGSLKNDDAPATDVAEASPSVAETVTPAIEDVASAAPAGTGARLGPAATGNTVPGAPPRNLGSMKLDASGNVVDSDVDFSPQSVERAVDGTNVASLGGTKNPEELYQAGYGYVLEGDYALAEGVFSTFIDTYPDDPLAADARFWLGESLLAQGNFEGALDSFIEARTLYPNAAKAPDTMLKIGTILAALGNREMACVTFDDALKTQTTMSTVLRKRISQERVNAKC